MNSYKIVILGAGPAGMMAGIRCCEILGDSSGIVLLEKNASVGRKLGLTGQGRCNVTNTCALDEFCGHFGINGQFLRNALHRLSPEDLMQFFEANGLKLKVERQGRVFPATDSSVSIISILKNVLQKFGVEIRLSYPVISIVPEGPGRFKIKLKDGLEILASRVIVAVGGSSYPETGSTGDGYKIAGDLGHTVTPFWGGLVPLEAEESFVREMQGLALKNVKIVFEAVQACLPAVQACLPAGREKIESEIGEMMFTHFGVSGPLVLDLSARAGAWLFEGKRVRLLLDLKPGLSAEELDKKIREELRACGNLMLKNYLKSALPQRFIDVFLRELCLDAQKPCHQVTLVERKKIVEGLKKFPFNIKRQRPLSEAMVTCGGVSLKEVDPRTMESKIVRGLYFCGEVLDLAASSGGYNLQAAFSTGYAAGEAAAKSLLQ